MDGEKSTSVIMAAEILSVHSLYPKVAPQFGHLLCLNARQKRIPIGKNIIAHRIPQQVKSSSKTPTLHAGHPPTTTTDVVVAGC